MRDNIISRELAIQSRNRIWQNNSKIPNWVDINNVDLDQFFTAPEVAEYCHNNLLSLMKLDGANNSDYKFVEPSAGRGAFFNLLPKDRRIGIDIMPMMDEIVAQDFLSWNVKPNGHRYVAVGNPPFGYRAWLALAFMNHAAKFSDYVGMILPMAFQSEGKGSPKHRVKGMQLVHSENLPKDSFTDNMGKSVKVNALWQVWKRGENIRPETKTCNEWLDLFTVDQRKERLCGQNRMGEEDFFLQRTFYNEPPRLVRCFSDVKYVCGYGIIIKHDKKNITKLLNETKWEKYSNLAAHNCRHISMYHIRKALTDAGYSDD